MKIILAQQNYHIGNFEYNLKKILNAVNQAKEAKADLIIFSEMCVCGYPPRDFVEFEDFITKCYESIDKIRQHSDGIGILIGSPARNVTGKGKHLFNAAFFLFNQQIIAETHKTLLPTYDIFDEYRYFEPADNWKVVHFMGKKIAVTICEDIWNVGDNQIYKNSPMEFLNKQHPDLLINLSASPFDYFHAEDRKSIIKANVRKYKIPVIYSNTVGSQTDLVFDGASMVFDKYGNLVKSLPMFKEENKAVELRKDGTFEGTQIEQAAENILENPASQLFLKADLNIERIHQALILGIRDYFDKMNFSKAIIGSSGGIDSAVTQALATEALGAENVRAILMPSPYSSEGSVTDAVELSENLGNPYDIVKIDSIYEQFRHTLEPIFKDMPFGLAEENMQSRIRGNILMSIANKFGYILLNTSNKSELSTGYGTLYGDMAGGLSVLGDCYKLQVFAIAKTLNRIKKIIPEQILTKAPSAELRPDQKDSDSLPDYAILDKILFQYIEKRRGPEEIKALGFDKAVIDKILRLVNHNEYKRNQFCPIIRISAKAFGMGRRVPIVAKYLETIQ